MRKPPFSAIDYVLTVLTCVLIAYFTSAFMDAYRTAKHLLPSDVYVETTTEHGSGVYVGHNMILTAAHVIGAENTVTVTDRAGTAEVGDVLWANPGYDLALIRIPDGRAIYAAPIYCGIGHIDVGDAISAVGNPLTQRFVTTYGRVAALAAPRGLWRAAFMASLPAVPGMSGGPVYNNHHALIGITVGMAAMPSKDQPSVINPFALTFIVPTSTACMLMGRVGDPT